MIRKIITSFHIIIFYFKECNHKLPSSHPTRKTITNFLLIL